MIEVRTCARLHLGLLDNNGEQGRIYGSIGLAVSRPDLLLRAEQCDHLRVEGEDVDRVKEYAQKFFRSFGLPEKAHLELVTGIPAHIGLGSGTQIALAVGTALARLAGLRLNAQDIALAGGRGVRSGIGIATFQHGGFIMDGGHRVIQDEPTRQIDRKVPPVLFQHSVPKDWHFVTVIPGSCQGFSGEREKSAFRRLPDASPHMVEKISRLVLMKMLPALVEEDIVSFGKALTGIQEMVGDCFATVQGGRYSNPVSEKIIGFMLNRGALGAGQSSWGPAVYGLIHGGQSARLLADEIERFLSHTGGGQVFCVRPRNRGASIRFVAPVNAAHTDAIAASTADGEMKR